MQLEWCLFILMLVLSSTLLWNRIVRQRKWISLGVALLMAGSVTAAMKWSSRLQTYRRDRAHLAQIIPREGRPGGYVSSRQCQACHPDQYASWHRSFHRTMTQYASLEAVKASFENVDLELEGATYHLFHQGDRFYVDMVDPIWKQTQEQAGSTSARRNLANGPRSQFRVGMLTGSHTMQAFWVAPEVGNVQIILPFAWLIQDGRWVPFHRTFLRDPAVPATMHVWNANCIKCHTTGPEPRRDPQTHGFDTRTGELGIACEACHGPGQEHVELNSQPMRRYQTHYARSGDSSIVNPARLDSKRGSEVCGQCHSIKWISNPNEWDATGSTFKPGQELNQSTPVIQASRLDEQPWLRTGLETKPSFLQDHYWSDGEVRVSGREFNGLIDSPCYQKGELSCLSCHSMHRSDPEEQLARGMDGNFACLQCHKTFESRIEEHTHHPAGSSGSECYNCHMPHTTYGLLKNIRSHRITSPNVAAALKTGRPVACNLCHLDRTLAWTAHHLHEWYKQPRPDLGPDESSVSAAVLLTLKGDAGQRALMAWHMGWAPAQQIAGTDWLAPYLGQLLDDPYSAVRYIAGKTIRGIHEFKDLGYDFSGSSESLRNAHREVLERWTATAGRGSPLHRPELLIQEQGRIEKAAFQRLLDQRDNKSMDLQE